MKTHYAIALSVLTAIGGAAAVQTPNFTRTDPGRPEIAILMDAMLLAREVIATNS